MLFFVCLTDAVVTKSVSENINIYISLNIPQDHQQSIKYDTSSLALSCTLTSATHPHTLPIPHTLFLLAGSLWRSLFCCCCCCCCRVRRQQLVHRTLWGRIYQWCPPTAVFLPACTSPSSTPHPTRLPWRLVWKVCSRPKKKKRAAASVCLLLWVWMSLSL